LQPKIRAIQARAIDPRTTFGRRLVQGITLMTTVVLSTLLSVLRTLLTVLLPPSIAAFSC
jgi:hypothetical protein